MKTSDAGGDPGEDPRIVGVFPGNGEQPGGFRESTRVLGDPGSGEGVPERVSPHSGMVIVRRQFPRFRRIVQAIQMRGNATVGPCPARVVHSIVDRMEDEVVVGNKPPRVPFDEPGLLQLVERLQARVVRAAGQFGQRVDVHGTPKDGEELQCALGVVIQLCQAARKNTGDGLRGRHEVAGIEVRQTPARACVIGELHNEERVPAAQFKDPVLHLPFDPALRNGVHQFRGSLPAEFAEKELARLVSHQGTTKQPADGVLLTQAIR
ncbi:MAG: hypothetical protein F4020_04995, partial [Gammaproteobacteria bacterium]|nr:hypothetical protein [Gammaproteobacteria bacterium]